MIRRALLLFCVLAAGCERESDPAPAAHAFINHVAAGRFDDAFGESAFFFQHQQTRREFQAKTLDLGLLGCVETMSDALRFTAGKATQDIEVRTVSGAHARLVITLTRDRGKWRVFSVKAPMNIETGIAVNYFTRFGSGPDIASKQDRPLPDEREVSTMTKETMLQFHDAIQQKSFEDFYDGIARSWQRDLPLGMLTRTFQGFIDRRTNLIAIKDMEAVLKERPRIDSDGLLVVIGSYPTQPRRIDFELKYLYEMPNWRPFGVTANLIR